MGFGPGQLKQDFESYLRGEEPTADELATAPRLEEWSATVCRDAERYEMRLSGLVTSHLNLPEGHSIVTSQVAWVDRKGRWARTRSRVYALGQRAGGEIPIE